MRVVDSTECHEFADVYGGGRRGAFTCKERKEANISAEINRHFRGYQSTDPREFSAAGPCEFPANSRELSADPRELSAGVFGKLAQKNLQLRDSRHSNSDHVN